ncbi:MAG TPA: hypothetical protein VK945_06125 [Planococcus sp. (in: firmicutes)]|nr:hypothetical protein [Planococcus sp. (in: firmicutes)]
MGHFAGLDRILSFAERISMGLVRISIRMERISAATERISSRNQTGINDWIAAGRRVAALFGGAGFGAFCGFESYFVVCGAYFDGFGAYFDTNGAYLSCNGAYFQPQSNRHQ